MAFAAASEHLDGDELSLTDLLVPHPERTMLFRLPADGPSSDMRAGDLVVVERGSTPKQGEYVLVAVDGEPSLRSVDALPDAAELILQGTATVLIRRLSR